MKAEFTREKKPSVTKPSVTFFENDYIAITQKLLILSG